MEHGFFLQIRIHPALLYQLEVFHVRGRLYSLILLLNICTYVMAINIKMILVNPHISIFNISQDIQSYDFSVRKVIHWFVCAPAFDKFIMIVIVFSSLAIAAEDPVDEDNPRNYWLSKADYVFTITFACEVCLKVNDIISSSSSYVNIAFVHTCFVLRSWIVVFFCIPGRT